MNERLEPEEEPLVGLESLKREELPPSAVEGRVIETLWRRGEIRQRGRNGSRAALAAAAVVFFATGMAVGRGTRPSGAADARPHFVLFLQPLPEEAAAGATHDSSRVAEYRAWAVRLRESGRDVHGEKLRAGFRVAGSAPSEPGAFSNESVGGYFVISAHDYDDALAVARDCPHARHGGTIVVRAIEPTG